MSPSPSASARTSTEDYEVDRQRHVRAMAARLPGELDRMTWPLERLHALRDRRLRELVRVAKERSPWHARRLRGVDPETLRVDDLSAIPPMTRADLMAHWDDTPRHLLPSLTGSLDRLPRYVRNLHSHSQSIAKR